MSEKLTKVEFEKWLAIEGEVRGMAIKSHLEFILKENGPSSLELLEKRILELGYSLELKKMESLAFYPLGLEMAILLLIKELFGFEDRKFVEIGDFSSKYSLIIKFFMKYFVSLKTTAKQAPNIWKRYYTVGDFSVSELEEKQKRVVLRLENMKLHPLHCLHLQGYCAGVIKMIVKSPVRCEETKCVFRGDQYHQFLLTWQ